MFQNVNLRDKLQKWLFIDTPGLVKIVGVQHGPFNIVKCSHSGTRFAGRKLSSGGTFHSTDVRSTALDITPYPQRAVYLKNNSDKTAEYIRVSLLLVDNDNELIKDSLHNTSSNITIAPGGELLIDASAWTEINNILYNRMTVRVTFNSKPTTGTLDVVFIGSTVQPLIVPAS